METHTKEEAQVVALFLGLKWGIFFSQNNTHFQTISLISIVSKLFRKLTSRVSETQVHCSNSSLRYSISMTWHGTRVLKTRVPDMHK